MRARIAPRSSPGSTVASAVRVLALKAYAGVALIESSPVRLFVRHASRMFPHRRGNQASRGVCYLAGASR